MERVPEIGSICRVGARCQQLYDSLRMAKQNLFQHSAAEPQPKAKPSTQSKGVGRGKMRKIKKSTTSTEFNLKKVKSESDHRGHGGKKRRYRKRSSL